MENKEIELTKIDLDIIPPIRQLLPEKNNNYKRLEESIKENGQHHSITLRRLSDKEKETAKPGTEYGIIDGQHRFRIAQSLKKKTILSNIEEVNINDTDRQYKDIVLALRMNDTAIKMNPLEKGKIIHDLVESTDKTVTEVGKEVFGLQHSMAYRYKKKYENSIVKNNSEVLDNPKHETFDLDTLRNAFGYLPTTKNEIDLNNLQNLPELQNKLKIIKTQIRLLEKHVISPHVAKAANEKTEADKNEFVPKNNLPKVAPVLKDSNQTSNLGKNPFTLSSLFQKNKTTKESPFSTKNPVNVPNFKK